MCSDQNEYFTSYENLEVHEVMLKDRPRQKAYHDAILQNASIFKGKVVLDVGAGSGILSAFCAKAGARLVYAVEASNLAEVALQLVEENEMTPVIKVVRTRIEEFALPPDAEKVDIIVSEWMGFYLLHEGMLDSVIYARDNFLAPDGLMFPNEATIYVAPCAVPSRFDNWSLVDGIRMNKFAETLRKYNSSKPEIINLRSDDLLHKGVVLHWMNLKEVTLNELDHIQFQEVVAVEKSGKHQGFCIWFDCSFTGDNYDNHVVLSTSPNSSPTHWKQCVVVLPDTSCEELEKGSPVAFHIAMKRNSLNNRQYNLEVNLLDPNTEEHPVPCECHLTKCILTKAHLQMTQMED